jgi:hypothetical protein
MRISVRNWNFMRLFRLIAGIAGTVQGFMMKEFALSLAGFFLVYMAIANVGCCGSNSCEVELKEANTSKEMNHEEVDARL